MFERIIETREGVTIKANAAGVTLSQQDSMEPKDKEIFIVREDIPKLIAHLKEAEAYQGD
jgi:hypothetical protein